MYMNQMSATIQAAYLHDPLLAARIESIRRRWPSPHTGADVISESSDVELVAKHLAGDPRAFSELVRRYTRAIYNVTYRYTADGQEAENLTQETFLRAWSALPRVALDRPLKPYLIKIAVNLCRDWAEKKGSVAVDSLEASEQEPASDEGDPVQVVSELELKARIQAKLDVLAPLQRTVIILRYSEGLSYDEMATALEMPVNTVRTHLHRAKARLRQLLEIE
jgi:RNA polymerase sigma-70 factor (ECF subfamily)